ncbi:ribonuclease P protein component [bacterium]|nr:ribonuclease P protein component [bacterium]
MIAKKFRLKSRKDFDQILKSKNKFYSQNLVLKFSKNDLDLSRFSVVVSKKISKKAVDRNLIRRRVYEIIRLNMDKIKKGWDLIIFSKKAVLNLDYSEIEKELFYILKKANLL